MFGQIIDGYIERFRPHALTAAAEARSAVSAITARLDMLIEAVQSEEFDETQRTLTYTIHVTDGVFDVADVAPGDQWELVGIVAMPAGATTFRIIDSGGAIRYSKALTSDETSYPLGVVFRGGARVQASTSAADVTFTLTFQMQHRKPPRTTMNSGMIEQGPDHGSLDPDPRQEAFNTARHANGSIHSGVNSIGDRADAYRDA